MSQPPFPPPPPPPPSDPFGPADPYGTGAFGTGAYAAPSMPPAPVPPAPPVAPAPGTPGAGYGRAPQEQQRVFQQVVSAPGVPQLQGPVIAPGERLERTFPVVRRQRALGWVESQFSVTNLRVLYRAKAKTFVGESISYREVNLADVNGLVLEGRRGFSASELVSLVVGFLLGLIALTFLSRVVTFGVLDLPAWMVLMYLAWILGGIGLFVIRLRAVEIVLALTAKGSDVTPVHMVGSSALLGASFLAGLLSPLALILEALGMYESDQAGNSATLLGGEQIYDEMGPLILALQDAQAGAGHGGA